MTRSRRPKTQDAVAAEWAPRKIDLANDRKEELESNSVSGKNETSSLSLKRGHTLSYAALFLFTAILYARPGEFYPSPVTASIALIVGLITLGLFVPTQLSLEGNLTAPLREVNLVLLFALAGLLSIPLAINPIIAWQEFSGVFIRCIVIFIVMVNVVRTETRLKALLLLGLVTGICLSLGAINDYRLGLMTVEGYRARGRGSAIFGNPNDMALFLVSMIPIATALAVAARTALRKLVFTGSAILMIAAIVLTYSRGGFLGLAVGLGFCAWRMAPGRKVEILLGGCLIVMILFVLMPGYALRLASILDPSLDPLGSSEARRGELLRSLYIAVRHPIFGIGMGNYASEMSYIGRVTHNSYTQVAAEMGLAALYCYTMFVVTPIKKLGQIARETFDGNANWHSHYLAIGLQASLVAYMVSSFFASVAYLWYVYYLVGYAICLRRIYESQTGKQVGVEKHTARELSKAASASLNENRIAAA